MKTILVILFAVFVLWPPFSVVSVASVGVALWAIFSDKAYAKNILRAVGRIGAAGGQGIIVITYRTT